MQDDIRNYYHHHHRRRRSEILNNLIELSLYHESHTHAKNRFRAKLQIHSKDVNVRKTGILTNEILNSQKLPPPLASPI